MAKAEKKTVKKEKAPKKAPVKKTGKRVGNKPTLSGHPGRTPARMLGRVPDNQWKSWKLAAKKSGENFSEWVRKSLDKASGKKAA